MTLPFDHTHDLDLGVSRSESEIALSPEWGGRLTMKEKDGSHPFMTMILTCVTMVGWADVPDSERGDFRRRRAVDISSLWRFKLPCIQTICGVTWSVVPQIDDCPEAFGHVTRLRHISSRLCWPTKGEGDYWIIAGCGYSCLRIMCEYMLQEYIPSISTHLTFWC